MDAPHICTSHPVNQCLLRPHVPSHGRSLHPIPQMPPPLSPQGLQDCVADLLQPFQGDAIDMVAGIDGLCPLSLGKGFLAIRKAGHLCVQTVTQPYTDYSGREKVMEVRTDAISPGLRILLVDQWVETGGTMRAAIELVEQLGGVELVLRGSHPSSCLPMSLGAAPRDRETPQPVPAPSHMPFLQSIKKVLLRQKGA
uniref:adenine phosphoribosyltransferase n=1 Tax=Catharus ustulatus TaxID=91951 RepID=A0A8C3U917_CATUS